VFTLGGIKVVFEKEKNKVSPVIKEGRLDGRLLNSDHEEICHKVPWVVRSDQLRSAFFKRRQNFSY
jgi:hypothetical protein